VLHLGIVCTEAISLLFLRRAFVNSVIARGCAVTAFSPPTTPEIRRDVAALGVTLIEIPLQRSGLNPFADARAVAVLARELRRRAVDAVLGYHPKGAIYGSIAARLVSVAHIVPMVTGLGWVFADTRSRRVTAVRAITLMLYRIAFSCSSAAVFHNLDDLAALTSSGCVPHDLKIFRTFGSGVDVKRFEASEPPSIESGVVFLMIARLLRAKGIGEYAAAAAALRKRYPGTRFLLVGPADTVPDALSLADLGAAAQAIDYHGPAADVRPYLRACHVFVLPSYREGMPGSVMEALSTGRPVVTTDTPGCRDTIVDGEHGYLVPVGDAVALERALETFILHPDRIRSMGRQARRRAEELFDVAATNATMWQALTFQRHGGRRRMF
jgi:glycosyltransferase involved in cell wall biosynthesis